MINVAVMGFGTVGSGVVEVLMNHENAIAKKADEAINVKYILDIKELPAELSDKLVRDFSVIEQDPEVDIVVETMGGVGAALEFTRRALKAGKSVVTSNKEVVAAHGYELTQLAMQQGVCYLFEASVGGGIPIIRPLSQCLAANDILELRGILNGTTNYILTRMIRAGLSFEDALAEAQQKGYAERDPSADVLGHDACRKICILSAIAFGRHVYPDQIPAQGITEITLEDVAYAAAAGKKESTPYRNAGVGRVENVPKQPPRQPETVLESQPYRFDGMTGTYRELMKNLCPALVQKAAHSA